MALASDILADTAAQLLTADGFDARWQVAQGVLEDLGAVSINAATLRAGMTEPYWFVTTLPEPVKATYISEDLLADDLVVQHAAHVPTPMRWDTSRPIAAEQSARGRAFGDFVRDAGCSALLCTTTRLRGGRDVRAVTFISDLSPSEVMHPVNVQRVEAMLQLLLPWLDWPEDLAGPDMLRLPHSHLTPREREALSLLAGGFMNARIAEVMGISEATVAKHLLSARLKLRAKTREEAVARAVRAGL